MERVKKVEAFFEEKEKCTSCPKIAVWVYMPSSKDGYYCEDCVPRGCSCNYHHANPNDFHPPLEEGEVPVGIEGVNWKWVEKPETDKERATTKEEGLFVYLDEEGREEPCCEFMYNKDGF